MGDERKITREDLYKLVWSKPLTELAKEFGISDVGLAKICKRLNVPRPYRGYWALLAAGRKMSIPKLPPAKKGTPGQAFITPYVKPEKTLEEDAHAALVETESLPENRIVVAESLRGAHPLVRETRKRLEHGFVDMYGRVFPDWSPDEKRTKVLTSEFLRLKRVARCESSMLWLKESRLAAARLKSKIARRTAS